MGKFKLADAGFRPEFFGDCQARLIAILTAESIDAGIRKGVGRPEERDCGGASQAEEPSGRLGTKKLHAITCHCR